MAHKLDVAQAKDELVKAHKQGDEARARVLVSQLGVGPRQVRGVLEAMLEDPHGLVRQAAAFGLGELGGTASARRLEQQLAMEEARGDHDGSAVVEDIVRALSRIEDAGARASLVRKLERLSVSKPERSDVYALASALWRRRHPDLIPAVRRSLEQISLPAPHGLHGLLVLLEKSPEELGAWARDPAVPVEYKARVLAVLEEDVPDTLISTLPSFIFAAKAISEQTTRQNAAGTYYCECLFSLLLADSDRFVVAQPDDVRSALRAVARSQIEATFPNPALWAAVVLRYVGRSEDAAFLGSYRPVDPAFAKIFDKTAQVLRNLH